MKRIVSLLLAAVLLFGMVPVAAQAATKLSITGQPKSVKVPEGDSVKLKVTATGDGLTYAWYYKSPGASSYKKSSITKATYSSTMKESWDGRKLYCKVTDQYGNSVKSETVTLTLGQKAKITGQPKSVKVPEGDSVKLKVTATGDGLTYAWYYKSPGASSYKKSSITKATYSSTMKESWDGRKLYCKVTDQYGNSVKSETVTLTLGATVRITAQPKDGKAPEGEKLNINVKATGDGLTYAWYYKSPSATSFKKSSVEKASYTSAMKESWDGRQLYCKVTDQYGNSVKTNTITLTLGKKAKITSQPADVSAGVGAAFTTKVKATGDGLTYAWYYKSPGSSTFKKSSIEKATYSSTMKESWDGRQLYCLVTDEYGNSVKSDIITLKVVDPLSFYSEPGDAYACIGDPVSFSAVVENGVAPYTFRWQYINSTMDGWVDFEDEIWASGYDMGTLSFKARQDDFDLAYRYRCIITDAMGTSIVSDEVCVRARFGISEQPVNVIGNIGDTVSFTVGASGGEGPYRYWWQYKTKNSDWAYVEESWIPSAENATLSFTVHNDEFEKEYQYRCEVVDENGESVISNAVQVMPNPLAIKEQPLNTYAKPGDKVSFLVEVEGGKAPYTYQWQVIGTVLEDWLTLNEENAGTQASGYNTAELQIELTVLDFEFCSRFRCIITDTNGNSIVSDEVWPMERLNIGMQPENVTADVGDDVSFTVGASGGEGPYRYWWQVRDCYSSEWQYVETSWIASAETATLSFKVHQEEFENEYEYRCEVVDENGDYIYSNAVRVQAGFSFVT